MTVYEIKPSQELREYIKAIKAIKLNSFQGIKRAEALRHLTFIAEELEISETL